jgi:hypothetical protein
MALQVLWMVAASIAVTVWALFDKRYRALDDDAQLL